MIAKSYAEVETQIQKALAEIPNCKTWNYYFLAQEFQVPAQRLQKRANKVFS